MQRLGRRFQVRKIVASFGVYIDLVLRRGSGRAHRNSTIQATKPFCENALLLTQRHDTEIILLINK